MTEIQFAYAAGFIDGEGCFSIWRNRRNHAVVGYGIKLEISNCDRQVLEILQGWFGYGGIRQATRANPRHNTCFKLKLAGQRLRADLARLEPFIIVKQRQLQVACQALNLNCRTGVPRSLFWHNEARLEKLSKLYEQMRLLNRRGIRSLIKSLECQSS